MTDKPTHKLISNNPGHSEYNTVPSQPEMGRDVDPSTAENHNGTCCHASTWCCLFPSIHCQEIVTACCNADSCGCDCGSLNCNC